MKISRSIVVLIASVIGFANAFSTTLPSSQCISASGSTQLYMANDEDLMRWARSSRSAGVNDRVVELRRPLGIVLNEDENGNVYVETVAPRGNAARTGDVKEGDIVVMCSATFGDQLWSTRGVGLTRVLSAIKVRAGPTVKLVLESTSDYKNRAAQTTKAAQAAEEARVRAQKKRDQLLSELEKDEQRLKKKKFLGLF
eukprot:CAMPEP_0178952328 /NCGR_PEP_ID=MMETSP0789-20121207/7745_1 /TAXON_ID=3005 /ORGANISM="Rhizosolenia setigera, Strain CCMP 1694" /LENGTH=197 /DNA_ID=CAMNT_0020633349 /DNA_START=203 /DNA_END=796 /DNA_ORIENTATION=-